MSSPQARFLLQFVTMLLWICLLGACGHEPVKRLPEAEKGVRQSRPAPIAPRRTPGEQAAIVAVRQVGVPYRYGGSTVKGFDCSGLVQFAYAKAGKSIPRTTADQWHQMSPVSRNDLRVGDLLFFRIDGRISHVGLYLGSRRFVHAPSSGREVTIAGLDSDFYRKAFVRGGRPR
jgi:cell wall-associated NlpC family hydrolase